VDESVGSLDGQIVGMTSMGLKYSLKNLENFYVIMETPGTKNTN
jgi:hypothetical protein